MEKWDFLEQESTKEGIKAPTDVIFCMHIYRYEPEEQLKLSKCEIRLCQQKKKCPVAHVHFSSRDKGFFGRRILSDMLIKHPTKSSHELARFHQAFCSSRPLFDCITLAFIAAL